MRGTTLLLPTAAAIALAIGASSTGCTPTERHFGTGGGDGGATTTSPTTSSSGGGGATSSSSSSSSGGGGGATSSSSSSSSSSGGGVETDCTNGVDDDGDGFVDCADPDCMGAGYQCAADAPTGWQGPALLYTGTDPPPGCDADWTQQPISGGLDVKSAPANCTTCTCGTPVGVQCDPDVQVMFATSPSCGNGTMQVAPFGQCIQGPNSSFKFLRAMPPQAVGGGCMPGGGDASVSPAKFVTQAAVCASPTGTGSGCGTGSACVPKAPAGYGPSLCIYQSGDLACPAGPYANKTLVYTTIVDKRGCSACNCDAPVGSTCDGVVRTFSYSLPTLCSSGTQQIHPADGACFQMGSNQYFSIVTEPAGGPIGGSCAPSGGLPTGKASGGQPATVCCQ